MAAGGERPTGCGQVGKPGGGARSNDQRPAMNPMLSGMGKRSFRGLTMASASAELFGLVLVASFC